MIKALDTATQGLLQAERRATDIAKDILKTTREAASFSLDDNPSQSSIPSDTATETNTLAGENRPSTTMNNGQHPGFGNLIQQFADLRAEQHAFEANAKVFKTIDETLGTLIDDVS